jgi:hypothetical protein
MPLELTNSLRNHSIARATGPGTYTIALTDLRKNPTTETVASADIKRIVWSTNANISIVRNSVEIATLHNSGEMRFDDWNHSIANNNNQSIVITIATGGTIVLELSKQSTFNVDPTTGATLP